MNTFWCGEYPRPEWKPPWTLTGGVVLHWSYGLLVGRVNGEERSTDGTGSYRELVIEDPLVRTSKGPLRGNSVYECHPE